MQLQSHYHLLLVPTVALLFSHLPTPSLSLPSPISPTPLVHQLSSSALGGNRPICTGARRAALDDLVSLCGPCLNPTSHSPCPSTCCIAPTPTKHIFVCRVGGCCYRHLSPASDATSTYLRIADPVTAAPSARAGDGNVCAVSALAQAAAGVCPGECAVPVKDGAELNCGGGVDVPGIGEPFRGVVQCSKRGPQVADDDVDDDDLSMSGPGAVTAGVTPNPVAPSPPQLIAASADGSEVKSDGQEGEKTGDGDEKTSSSSSEGSQDGTPSGSDRRASEDPSAGADNESTGTPTVTGITPRTRTDETTSTSSTTVATSTTTQSEDGPSCFPADALVRLESGEMVEMENVQIGDRVQVGRGRFSDVFAFTHRITEGVYEFVRLETDSGAVVTVHRSHYIYVNGELEPAKRVVVGAELSREDGSRDAVRSVKRVQGRGLFNPQTLDGDIIVNNILASTYTTAVEPWAAHAGLSILRGAYNWMGFALSSSYMDRGAPEVAQLLLWTQA